MRSTDYGPEPFVVNIAQAATSNTNFRTALWTGEHLQVTLMSIPAGGEIGIEIHEDTDQFIRVEQGCGTVQIGDTANAVRNILRAGGNTAVLIPAGTWHNVINCGPGPLKLYSIYAPPHHPAGTVQRTKADAERA